MNAIATNLLSQLTPVGVEAQTCIRINWNLIFTDTNQTGEAGWMDGEKNGRRAANQPTGNQSSLGYIFCFLFCFFLLKDMQNYSTPIVRTLNILIIEPRKVFAWRSALIRAGGKFPFAEIRFDIDRMKRNSRTAQRQPNQYLCY